MGSMIGKTVSHYEILEKLGEGGMGVVYKARDTRLHRHVAIKFLPPHDSADEQAKTRLSHEARALSALNHSNIAVIHEIDETADGQMFIVMAYYEGATLKDKLGEGKLAVDEAVEIVSQLASGLAKAHEKGILHRDIKPANVLLSEDGEAKLADFGLARLAGHTRVTKTGTTVGTVAYMSPEQARGDAADERSDVFSLGVVMYQLLTGELPFDAEHQAALLYKIMNEEPAPLKSFRPDLGDDVQRLVDRALAKDVEARYQGAREFLRDLKNVQRGRQIDGLPRRRTPMQRRVLWGAVAVVAAFAAFGISTRWMNQPPPGPDIASVAVLPIQIAGDDPEYELLAAGITGELIARLSRIGALRVIAQHSVAGYAGTEKSLAEIADELNVEALVECSMQIAGDRIHITAELIDPAASDVLWGDTFDGSLSNALSLQGDLALGISEAVGAHLTESQTAQLTVAHEVDPEVYKAYLNGMRASEEWSSEAWDSGIKYFNEAIDGDATFAPAYAGISRCYGFKGWFNPGQGFDEMQNAAALKAIELDPLLAEGHVALADYQYRKKFRWDDAERTLLHALELAPGSAICHIEFGNFLVMSGRAEEGLAHLKRARELDPLNRSAHRELGLAYLHAHRYDDGIAYLLGMRERFPGYGYTEWFLALCYSGKGEHETAIAMMDSLVGVDPHWRSMGAVVYARGGEVDTALEILEEDREAGGLGMNEFTVNAALGRYDEALAAAERIYETSPVGLMYLNIEPISDEFRTDPRLQELFSRVGLGN